MSEYFSKTSPPQSAASSATASEKRAHKEQPRIRRRNRLITSCLECRRRKLKCDKQQPCTNCTKFSRGCVFLAPGLDPEAQAKLAEVKEKMGMLEKTLEEDVARRKSSRSSYSPGSSAPMLPGQDADHSDQEEEEDARGLESTELITEDALYYEEEGNEDIVDLGISIGRLRITERIGGLVRPRFSEELAQALEEDSQDATTKSFPSQSPGSWMSPSSDYVAPSSSFFFAPGIEKTSMMTYLPSKVLVDKLMAHYWQAVHPILRTLHRPLFERQYQAFWKNIASGVEPRFSFQAVVFAALLSSIISMSEEKVLAEFAVEKQSLLDNFRQATESALARANFLRTTKLETLQAFVMYLLPLCRAEVSRAHSALTGTCIRLAECMGLHRDPTSYSSDPIEIHIRRLIWYQICFLDIRTCEATGPRPQIRREEYDTRFPLNVSDADLERAVEQGEQLTEDRPCFTDMTITRMRFECFEMIRLLWVERPKLSRKPEKGEKKVTITSLLSRIQGFKAAMEKTYLPLFNKTDPQHVIAMEMYGILSSRLYIMVLHPFASNAKRKMPERLRQIMISGCIMILEHSMTIEQQPALAQWSWYIGALHQYHTALLLLNELGATRPEPAMAARIWRCLDFAFEVPASLPSAEKANMILKELVERTGTYATIRKMRAPSNMPRPGARKWDAASSEKEAVGSCEERDRSSSVQSASSSFPPAMTSTLSPQLHPQLQQQQHRPSYPNSSLLIRGPLGAMPNTDWGTFDFNAPVAQPTPLPTQQPSYDFGGFALPSPQQGLLNIPTSAGSDTSSTPTAAGMSGGSGSGTGGSPMDAAINDIDWNEWEQLFGGAQMGEDTMLIPPFTFPQFEPTDLQWLGQEGAMQQ